MSYRIYRHIPYECGDEQYVETLDEVKEWIRKNTYLTRGELYHFLVEEVVAEIDVYELMGSEVKVK